MNKNKENQSRAHTDSQKTNEEDHKENENSKQKSKRNIIVRILCFFEEVPLHLSFITLFTFGLFLVVGSVITYFTNDGSIESWQRFVTTISVLDSVNSIYSVIFYCVILLLLLKYLNSRLWYRSKEKTKVAKNIFKAAIFLTIIGLIVVKIVEISYYWYVYIPTRQVNIVPPESVLPLWTIEGMFPDLNIDQIVDNLEIMRNAIYGLTLTLIVLVCIFILLEYIEKRNFEEIDIEPMLVNSIFVLHFLFSYAFIYLLHLSLPRDSLGGIKISSMLQYNFISTAPALFTGIAGISGGVILLLLYLKKERIKS